MTTTTRVYDTLRWNDLIGRQRRGELGELTPDERDAFSVLASWNYIDDGELATRCGFWTPTHLDEVLESLGRKLEPHGLRIATNTTGDEYELIEVG